MDKDRETARLSRATLGVIPLAVEAADDGHSASDHLSYVVFEISREVFAVGIEQTEGVVDCPRISPLPNAPDGVVGVVSVRGRITLVMDVSSSANQQPGKRRLILLKGEAQLGLLADSVAGVFALKPKEVKKLRAKKHEPVSQTSRSAKLAWLADSYFVREGNQVPVINVNRLAEG